MTPRRSYSDVLTPVRTFPLPYMCGGTAQAISTGTAKTPQAAEGEACERGPEDAPEPLIRKGYSHVD